MPVEESFLVKRQKRISLVIPALDEAASMPAVLASVPRELVEEIIVVDNGSKDQTALAARAGGARVVSEPRRGYGFACLAGARAAVDADIIVFMDGDYSDDPSELPVVTAPLLEGQADLVIGSRTKGSREPFALLPHVRMGNALAAFFIRILFGHKVTDLGPFRAISTKALRELAPTDTGYGFPVQIQARAIARGLRVVEVPVSYRRRIGRSKISGTVRGTVLAGSAILSNIFKEYLRRGKGCQETGRHSGED